MKVLVTGSNGFVGKNICEFLKRKEVEVLSFDINNTIEELEQLILSAEFIVHLAGINRPLNKEEFKTGNYGLTVTICELLKKHKKKTPIILSSSTQASLDNEYGISKKAAEDYLLNFSNSHGDDVFIYRFANLFGKWCKPNYNSVIATFCHNISRDIEIKVNKDAPDVEFVYIDDVMNTIYKNIIHPLSFKNETYIKIKPSYFVSPLKVAELLNSFKKSRENLLIIDQKDEFSKKLYATYLSYLPTDKFSYKVKMNVDNRGSFTELLKTDQFGQVSVNVGKPGITKGNHYHHTKNEKFIVVSGTCEIKFRKIGCDEVISIIASGDNIEVIDIPTGYTHNITNIGENDSITIMWANELFDPNNPDTYFEEV